MEERLARLEVRVDHIQADVTEIKADVRRLNDKLDAAVASWTDRFEAANQRWSEKFDDIKDSIAGLKVARIVDRVWWLVIAAAMLGVMARGFKWI